MENTLVHNVSTGSLRMWELFKHLDDGILQSMKSVYVFFSPRCRTCRGGIAAFFITSDDQVYGIGHNCKWINILGFSPNSPHFRAHETTQPQLVDALSQIKIKSMSIGHLVGAAISGSGALYWWGQCYKGRGEVFEPHRTSNTLEEYVLVSCGQRMMAALTEAGKVFVWGQFVNSRFKYMVAKLIVLNSPVASLSCGLHHIALMNTDGYVFSWGRSNLGQRGYQRYTDEDMYEPKMMTYKPCIDVKCGPYSTFCLTKFNEILHCGTNCLDHRDNKDNGTVLNISRAPLRQPVTQIEVVWGPRNQTKIAALTTDSDIYVWGCSRHPELKYYLSFFDMFTSWKVTPGTTDIMFSCETSSETSSYDEAATAGDLLTYNFYRQRTLFPTKVMELQSKIDATYPPHIVNELTFETLGKDFILQKFLNELEGDPILPEWAGWNEMGSLSARAELDQSFTWS